MAVQAAATLPLAFLGSHGSSIALVLCATFVGGVANLVAIVGFMVAATAGMPDHEQGLATGLATTSQQVGITLGIPVMSAIATARLSHLGAATPGHVLSAVSLAIGINAAVALATAVVAWRGLPPQACSGAPR
jgi:predicted MFS family arabinose efflux permease